MEPDQVKQTIEVVRPYAVGSLGAVGAFFWEVINKERALSWTVLALWVVLGAMFASWMDEELTYLEQKWEFVVHGRGLILFFSGGGAWAAYPKVREAFIAVFGSILNTMAERLKAVFGKSSDDKRGQS